MILHTLILSAYNENFSKTTDSGRHRFNIDSIRTVGEMKSDSTNSVFIPKQRKTKRPEKKELESKAAPKNISLSDLSAPTGINSDKKPPVTAKQLLENPQSPLQAIKLDNKNVKTFLQNTPNSSNAQEYSRAFGESNVLVDLEVPKGVAEDELNQHELVFYGFRKRTALNYINAFYNELIKFQQSNPHLEFPMTQDQESMTGRITYDKNGEIVRIKMLKWTNKKALQDFFLSVLQNMNTLPNPPEIIVENGEFHVYYSLTVNGKL